VKDLWFMMFYGSGINLSDLLRLKWKDINFKEYCFTFLRGKTKERNFHDPVRVELKGPLAVLFNEYCTKNMDPEEFVFPFLYNMVEGKQVRIEEELEQTQLRDLIVTGFNNGLKRIWKNLGWNPKQKKAISYTCRHTYVNEALNYGIDVETLIKNLGQHSVEAFRHYNNRPLLLNKEFANTMYDRFTKIAKEEETEIVTVKPGVIKIGDITIIMNNKKAA
jgi:integrase